MPMVSVVRYHTRIHAFEYGSISLSLDDGVSFLGFKFEGK